MSRVSYIRELEKIGVTYNQVRQIRYYQDKIKEFARQESEINTRYGINAHFGELSVQSLYEHFKVYPQDASKYIEDMKAESALLNAGLSIDVVQALYDNFREVARVTGVMYELSDFVEIAKNLPIDKLARAEKLIQEISNATQSEKWLYEEYGTGVISLWVEELDQIFQDAADSALLKHWGQGGLKV